jgi:hypothetical protein
MSTQVKKRSDQIAADQALLAGVQKFLVQYPSLTVGSQSMTSAAIVTALQNRINANQAVQTAEAARTAAVKANQDERAQSATFEQGLRQVVQGMFSQSPDSLAVFGLKPRKSTKKTVATKTEAVAKNKATRAARHTMGPKQKLEITGATPAAGDSGTSAAPVAASGASPAPVTTSGMSSSTPVTASVTSVPPVAASVTSYSPVATSATPPTPAVASVTAPASPITPKT